MTSLFFHSFAFAVPQKKLTNDDLAQLVETSDEWIRSRTGIASRYILESGQNISDLAAEAGSQALAEAHLPASELTHIIVATGSPDSLSPSLACIVAGKIGAGAVMAFDFSAACSGFIYGLSLCEAFVAQNPQAKILFICAEGLSRRLNWKDRSTCVLFGDGASASLVTNDSRGSIACLEDCLCASDGKAHDFIVVGGGTSCEYAIGDEVDSCFFLRMNGRETYKYAIRAMSASCQEILQRNGLSLEDIALFIPHQANIRIIEAVGERLGVHEGQVFSNIEKYGNTSSPSIPLALTEAWKLGRIPSGAKVLTTAFGSGLTWGAALLRFS